MLPYSPDGPGDNYTAGASRPDRRGAFLLLFGCLLLIGAGNTMLITAVLPPLTRELGFPDWTAGAIFSFSALLWAVVSPVWGRLSGEWGRRRIVAIGMFGFSISMALFGFFAWLGRMDVISYWPLLFVVLLLARSLFGLLGSGANPAAQAYVADRTTIEERTTEIANLTAGFTLGSALGPAIAAALVVWLGLLSPVWITAVLAAATGYYVLVKLPEKTLPRAAEVASRKIGDIWKDPKILPYLVFGLGLSLISGIMVQTFPYTMMDRMSLEGTTASQFIAAATTLSAMATLLAQLVLIPRIQLPTRGLMVAGGALLSLAFAIMITTDSFAIFCLSQILFGLGQGLARPGFMAGASIAAGPDQQGAIAGLSTAVNGAGFVISPFFGLWMYGNVSGYAPFIIAVVVCGVMTVYAGLKAAKDDGEGPMPIAAANDLDPEDAASKDAPKTQQPSRD